MINEKLEESKAKFVDAAMTLPVKASYQGMGMMGGPVNNEEMFSDFREVSGVKLPFKSITHQDGKKAQEATASEIVLNATVDKNVFVVKQ